MRVWLVLFVSGCVRLEAVPPSGEITVIAVSAAKDPGLAESVARNRATARAVQIKQGLSFILDRSRGKPRLKVISEGGSAGVIPTVEPRKPLGARATLSLPRSPQELQALQSLPVAHVKTEASGLDLAVAQDRADRKLYEEAILTFAKAESNKDRVLSGRLTVVNYRAEDDRDVVRVRADIHVKFGPLDEKKQTQTQEINEELEEVEPPEEQR